MTYSEQLEIIKAIPIKEGERRIITCPICYGPKKMSVSKSDGQLMWNCFRASCNAKGIYSGRRNLQSIKNYLSNTSSEKNAGRPLPDITTSVENHQPAIDYLKSVNSFYAYSSKLIKVRYVPSDNRVLFIQEDGAVGRLLSGYGPKWVSYGMLECGVSVGTGNTVVLVEDIPSACSVARIDNHIGLALLGTKISHNISRTLNNYTKVFLVLDSDASNIAIKQSRIHAANIHVRLTKRDLKLLSVNQIIKVLYGDY